MKKITVLFGMFLFTLLINSNAISASADLLVDEDYILKDPITNKYSSDWSHLNTPENIQLQKDVQNYFSKDAATMQIQSYELNGEQENYEEDLNKRVIDFLSQIDPEIATYNFQESNLITPMSSYDLPSIDSVMVKILEGKLHLAAGKLSVSDIAVALENSNGARDHAIRYAQNNNFYQNGRLITWDNTADTLRHFAWNFMNSNDLGVSKAKTTGDMHEVALIALDILNNDADNAKLCSYNLSCMQTIAVQDAMSKYNYARNNLTTFNNTFDNSSVMDLINNEKGRQAFEDGNSTYSVPFNNMLKAGELIKTPNSITSSLRKSAWLDF